MSAKETVINKKKLGEKLALKFKIKKNQSANMIEYIFDSIKDELLTGNDIKIVRFGTFKLRNRIARKGRNPKTGETIQLPPITTVGFFPGKTLKKMVKTKD